MKIPFFKPALSPQTYKSVEAVLDSGWLTTGKRTEEFETQFSKYVGSTYSVMINSGTAALHLSLVASGIQPGDEVITTPYTFAATSEVIEYMGATPVFVDVSDKNLNIDETKIDEKITKKTKAILPVHFSGNPCEMDSILEISQSHSLKIIEDAAHCTPAYYKKKSIGSIGDCTCFSFYANKCITTGEGGMLTTDDKKIAEQVKILRLHGLSQNALNRYNTGGDWEYDITTRGYKYNPTDISAAIGIEQLKMADEFLKQRTQISNKYQELLGNDNRIKFIKPDNRNQSSWHLFPIRLQGGLVKKRNKIIEKLAESGISVAVHFKPLHLHSYYVNKYGYKPEDFPIATDAFYREITLPVYPGLKDLEIEYITTSLTKILDSF